MARIDRRIGIASLFVSASVATVAMLAACDPAVGAKEGACDTAGLILPPGFCATVFADKLGHARHMVVAPDGTVYVNTWSGAYFREPAPPGGFIVALRDRDGDGRADWSARYGQTKEDGAKGGVGIALHNGSIYAEVNDRIVRYAISKDGSLPRRPSATVLSGMPLGGDHPMHPFIIDRAGALYVNMGSATNACDVRNRVPNGRGHQPCTELHTRGGGWLYDANKTGQRFSPAERYVSGIRNTGGLSFDRAGRLFAVQHGRDQLAQNWSKFYTTRQGAELPAEELLLLTKGADFGWPTCYYNGERKQLMLAPEYGGDGKTVGPCAGKQGPVAALPAHWAPNDVLIYTGKQFPAAYHGGAFIAFHGSWNRAPEPQGGYNLTFQPLRDGRASGPYSVFADGFAGAQKDPGEAEYRPTGLAMAPDGALYVSDDQRGRIWRITYQGAAQAGPARAPQPPPAAKPAAAEAATLTPPPGFSPAQLALGEQIFHGKARAGTCAGCHGTNGGGSPMGSSLIGGQWLWTDGSVGAIARVIATGVAKPKHATGAMPPKGGSPLSDSDVRAVAAYVWALNHARH
jgi:glucose/arabinose dehydrogenase